MNLSHRILVALAALSLSATACDSAEKNSGAKADAGKKADAKAEPAKDDAKPAAEEKAEPAAEEEKPSEEKPAEDAEPAAEEKPADAAPAALPEAGDAGPAYFAIDDKGVFMLEGGTFTAVKKGPDKLVKQMSIGGDGKPYMLAYDGIMALEGATAKVVAMPRAASSASVNSERISPAYFPPRCCRVCKASSCAC